MVSYLPKVTDTEIYRKEGKTCKPLFFSKDFLEEHPNPKMANHQLTEKQLREQGVIVTQIRRELEDAAEVLVKEEMRFHKSIEEGEDLDPDALVAVSYTHLRAHET